MKGWISIHRQLQDHWLWQERRVFSRAEAWIDILLNVNHAEAKIVIKNDVYNIGRGESLMSLDTWGKRWGWNKSKVRRFFGLLEKDGMIRSKSETKTTRITICNYESYQTKRNADETQVKRIGNAGETHLTPNNNDNKKNNENNENKREGEISKINSELRKELFNSSSWLTKLCMDRKTDLVNLKISLDKFLLEAYPDDYFGENKLNEIKVHFGRWLKHNQPVQIDINKKAREDAWSSRQV